VAPTKVAILGAGFIADVHMESYSRFVPDAQVTAVYSRTPEHAQHLAKQWKIPQVFTDLDRLFAEADCEVVDICLPNFLHHKAALGAAYSGRHVIVEKPLCMTLEEADEMIAVCREHKRKLMYAEELCFAPKYERVRALVKEGAVGDIYMLKQLEKHSGPHTDWFWNVDQSGGGVMMDMGCHAFGWFRWMLGNRPVKSVWATMDTVRHKARTKGEDNTVCLVEFEGGVIGLAEDSWAKPGGMDDRVEVYGT
jgi:myo-inositol 2-dehydrogenase/D-chiro-inositol 1-dehydrogenase